MAGATDEPGSQAHHRNPGGTPHGEVRVALFFPASLAASDRLSTPDTHSAPAGQQAVPRGIPDPATGSPPSVSG